MFLELPGRDNSGSASDRVAGYDQRSPIAAPVRSRSVSVRSNSARAAPALARPTEFVMLGFLVLRAWGRFDSHLGQP
jgi:hypothetical protein